MDDDDEFDFPVAPSRRSLALVELEAASEASSTDGPATRPCPPLPLQKGDDESVPASEQVSSSEARGSDGRKRVKPKKKIAKRDRKMGSGAEVQAILASGADDVEDHGGELGGEPTPTRQPAGASGRVQLLRGVVSVYTRACTAPRWVRALAVFLLINCALVIWYNARGQQLPNSASATVLQGAHTFATDGSMPNGAAGALQMGASSFFYPAPPVAPISPSWPLAGISHVAWASYPARLSLYTLPLSLLGCPTITPDTQRALVILSY